MKKYILFTVILLLPCGILDILAQNNLSGRYQNYFGSSIDIDSNGTFAYRFAFDLVAKWAVGSWSGADTIVLVSKPIYDMVPRANPINGIYYDSLVLSADTISSHITREELLHLPTYGQDVWLESKRFLLRKNRLYPLSRNNKVVTKKQRGFWTMRKFPSYYFKM